MAQRPCADCWCKHSERNVLALGRKAAFGCPGVPAGQGQAQGALGRLRADMGRAELAAPDEFGVSGYRL